MGPSKERSKCGQRTFLSLMLIGVVVFVIATAAAWSLFSFASRLHQKTSEGCYILLTIYQPSVIDRFTRKATVLFLSRRHN